MRTSDFCYWLQGYFELSGAKELNTHQVNEIKKQLQTVCSPNTQTRDVSKYLQDLPSPPPIIEATHNRYRHE